MECENSYHCPAEKNIAFHIHLHTSLLCNLWCLLYGAQIRVQMNRESQTRGGNFSQHKPPSPLFKLKHPIVVRH